MKKQNTDDETGNKKVLNELHKIEYSRKKLAKKRRNLLIKLKLLNEDFRVRPEFSLEKGLKKIYTVRNQRAGNVIKCRINLPLCFLNKKVKLRIIK